MKKIISLILVLIVCMAVCSCEKKEPEQNGEEKRELTVWAILSPECTDYAYNYQTQWYEEKNGIKINWVTVPQQGWANAFKLSIMGGEWPDIYLYDFSTTEVTACVDFGTIIPLNDLIDKKAPNIKNNLANDPELKKTITATDGNIYTLYEKSYNEYAYTQKMWVNTEWLEQYTNETGKTVPKTLEEFKSMLEYFRDNDMNKNGDNNDEIPYLGADGLDGFFTLAGGYIPCNGSSGYGCYITDKNDVEFTLNKPEFREGLKYIEKLFAEGLISDKTFTSSTSNRHAYVGNNISNSKVGVITAVGINDIINLTGKEGDFDYTAYTVLPPPEGPNGFSSVVTSGEERIALKNAITTSCKDPELAMEWLDYWYSEEGRLWNVNGGQENKHWWYEEGVSVLGPGKVVVKSSDSELMKNASWGRQGVACMRTKADFEQMALSSAGTNNALCNYLADREYSKQSIKSKWPSIVWANEHQKDLATEYSELNTLISNYVTESYTAFVTGKKDINSDSEWQVYCDELEKMGLQRYIELVAMYCTGS